MTLSDSMFLFEIVVEKLLSYVSCKNYYVKIQFADIFELTLKDPNDLDQFDPTVKSRKKRKLRNIKARNQKPPKEEEVQSGVSIFTGSTETLIRTMENSPLKATLFNKDKPYPQLGSTYIPWNLVYIDYLSNNYFMKSIMPAQVSGYYTIYDEITFKHVAKIKLKIRLSYLGDKVPTSFRSFSDENQNNDTKEARSYNNYTLMENIGIIKTIYGGGKRKNRPAKKNKNSKEPIVYEEIKANKPPVEKQKENIEKKFKLKTCITHLTNSDTDLDKNRRIQVLQSNSCPNMSRKHVNILKYIFGDSNRPLGNHTYCVGYFTVENDLRKDPNPSNASLTEGKSSDEFVSESRYRLKLCEKDCSIQKNDKFDRISSSDLPMGTVDLNKKYKLVKCDSRKFSEVPPTTDDSIQIDLRNYRTDCCEVSQAVEKVVGEMKAKLNFDEHDCFCSCECTFGVLKHTTYYGDSDNGFEVGEDVAMKSLSAPMPSPVYQYDKKKSDKTKISAKKSEKIAEKIAENSAAKTYAYPKKLCSEFLKKKKGSKKPRSDKIQASDEAMGTESEEDYDDSKGSKNGTSRFKFNYGFTGIPVKIGHSRCLLSDHGHHDPILKDKGKLSTAKDAPGAKVHSKQKTRGRRKRVKLGKGKKVKGKRSVKVLSTMRKKDLEKKKRPLKRPLLIVSKKDGEYTVTMETMKTYPNPRTRYQQPYEDKPLLTYTVGRTEEENRERRKKREREQRLLKRDQREFIQSAFSNMCKDICLKTYQQALGILPGAEDSYCPCYSKEPGADDINLDQACSCSDDGSFGSDTDSDEWILEFTPPNAVYDATNKPKKVVNVDDSTQYTYLDYRVTLLDKQGNQIPRFFKGPDGNNQCSDLGGFWSPEHKWLKINSDGYIGPDGRWAPMVFIGPDGDRVNCKTGKFQAADDKWLVVGVDGYVDETGKWKFYAKPKGDVITKTVGVLAKKRDTGDKKDTHRNVKKAI